MEEWITKKEVLDILGISLGTLDRMMRDGKLTYYKNGFFRSASVKFKREDVLNYLEKMKRN